MYFICCTCPRVRPVRIETVTFFLPSHALGKADKVARRSRLLDIMSLVVTVVAALTYLASLLFDPAAFAVGGFVGLAVTLVGVALTRKYLWAGSIVVVLGGLTSAFLDTDPIAIWTLGAFTAFSVALRGRRGVLLGALIALGMYSAVVLAEDKGYTSPVAIAAFASCLAAAAAGSALRSYGRYLEGSERLAMETIASREAESHQKIAEERLRIARDLHDMVGHEVAVLGIHLGVIEVNTPIANTAARTALDSARSSVQSVLLETQRILEVLRSVDPDADPLEDNSPTADFTRIDDLVDRYRRAGVDIDARLASPPPVMDPTVSTAAYRLLQELLTNSQKHGTGPVTVRTDIEGPTLTISTSNDVFRAPAGKKTDKAETGDTRRRGLGLVGMRERAHSAGGRLDVNQSGETFTVTATLNLDGSGL
jgi:signal transduction histidine kinase